MLNNLLGWIIALGSVGLYLSGFLWPEVHRKNDLIWSGVGLFYALILWIDSDRISGELLLGQSASVALTVWLGWQAIHQRRQLTPPEARTPSPGSFQGYLEFGKQGWARLQAHFSEGGAVFPVSEDQAEGFPLDFAKLQTWLTGLFQPQEQTAHDPSPSSESDGKTLQNNSMERTETADTEVIEPDVSPEDVPQAAAVSVPAAETASEAETVTEQPGESDIALEDEPLAESTAADTAEPVAEGTESATTEEDVSPPVSLDSAPAAVDDTYDSDATFDPPHESQTASDTAIDPDPDRLSPETTASELNEASPINPTAEPPLAKPAGDTAANDRPTDPPAAAPSETEAVHTPEQNAEHEATEPSEPSMSLTASSEDEEPVPDSQEDWPPPDPVT